MIFYKRGLRYGSLSSTYKSLLNGSLSICVSLLWVSFHTFVGLCPLCRVSFLHKGAGLFNRSLFKYTTYLRVSFHSSLHSSLSLFSLWVSVKRDESLFTLRERETVRERLLFGLGLFSLWVSVKRDESLWVSVKRDESREATFLSLFLSLSLRERETARERLLFGLSLFSQVAFWSGSLFTCCFLV